MADKALDGKKVDGIKRVDPAARSPVRQRRRRFSPSRMSSLPLQPRLPSPSQQQQDKSSLPCPGLLLSRGLPMGSRMAPKMAQRLQQVNLKLFIKIIY